MAAAPLVSVMQLFGTADINVTDALLYHEHDDDKERYRYYVTRASQRSRKRSEGVWVGTPQLSPSDDAWLLMLASVNGLINGQIKNYHPDKEDEKSKIRIAQNSRYEPVEKALGKFISQHERAYGKKRAAALARGEDMPTFAKRKLSKGVKLEANPGGSPAASAPVTPPLKPSSADKSSPAFTLCVKQEHCCRSFNHRGHCKVRPPPVEVGDGSDGSDSEDDTPLSTRLAACTVKRGSCYATRAKGPAAAAAAAAAALEPSEPEVAAEPEEPPEPPGFPVEKWDDLAVGQEVWALDCDGFWLRAKLTSVWVPDRAARVHYLGWNVRYDETLTEGSGKLRLKEKPAPPPPPAAALPYKKRQSSLFNLNFTDSEDSDDESDEEEVECDAVEAEPESAAAEPAAAATEPEAEPAVGFVPPAPLAPLPEVPPPPAIHSARSMEAAGALVQYAAAAAEPEDPMEDDVEDDVEDESDGGEDVTVASLAN